MEFCAYIMEISEYVSSKVSCSLPFGQVGFPAAQLTASQNILPIFYFSQTRYKRYIDNSHLKRHESICKRSLEVQINWRFFVPN